MTNFWTGKIVGFHPLIQSNQLLGFAIVSDDCKMFYEKDANYNSLLAEAKSVIVFDSYDIINTLKDFKYTKHNLRTLYFQLKSQIRFQTVKDLIKQEYYSIKDDNIIYNGNSNRISEARQTVVEASFIRDFYLENYKKVNKNILKLDNSLLKELSSKSNRIKTDQLAIRTDISTYQLGQWNSERKIFNLVGYPVVSISQLPYNQQQNKIIQKLFENKNKYKSKYESLVRYLGLEDIDLNFDVTGASTGRIICRGNNIGLFAPDNEYKQNFCSIDGYTLISADYSKQEASILACVTNDSKLQKDLQNKNYYAKLAKLLIGVEDKQTGKDLFYALIYGVSIKTLADKLSISENKAEYVKNKLEDRYSSLTKWLKTIKKLKENYFGRKLYESTANAYVQSTAADIVRMKLLETLQYNPICVFSDNIIYSVPEGNVNKYKEEIKNILEDVKPFKLRVLVKSSKNFNFN